MDRMQEERFYVQRFNNGSPAKSWSNNQRSNSSSENGSLITSR
jgi:hypothetical protein